MVMHDNSCSKGCGFESRHHILDGHFGHFFTLICCRNCIVCLKKTENKRKEAGVGPFFRKHDQSSKILLSATVSAYYIGLFL